MPEPNTIVNTDICSLALNFLIWNDTPRKGSNDFLSTDILCFLWENLTTTFSVLDHIWSVNPQELILSVFINIFQCHAFINLEMNHMPIFWNFTSHPGEMNPTDDRNLTWNGKIFLKRADGLSLLIISLFFLFQNIISQD